MISAVETLSQGEARLRPGTLYGALDRLADQGLVEVDREEAVDGRLRRNRHRCIDICECVRFWP